jgi:hypothetical protein
MFFMYLISYPNPCPSGAKVAAMPPHSARSGGVERIFFQSHEFENIGLFSRRYLGKKKKLLIKKNGW